MKIDDALSLARLVKYSLEIKPSDPLPGVDEAIEILKQRRKIIPHQWITGTEAIKILESGRIK